MAITIDVEKRSVPIRLPILTATCKTKDDMKSYISQIVSLDEISLETDGLNVTIFYTIDIGDTIPDAIWKEASRKPRHSGDIWEQAQRDVGLMMLEEYVKQLLPTVVNMAKRLSENFVNGD